MIDQTFTVDGSPDLEVRIESGRVEINQGRPDRVEVRVDGQTSGIIVEQRGNSVIVATDVTAPWSVRGGVSVVIETPPRSDLKVSVASAEVRVNVETAKTEVKTASGDIEVNRTTTLVVKTASGDVEVGSVERSLRFVSASGDMHATEVSGSLLASTASGDIHVERCDASVEANSASGDIRIDNFTGKSANFKTMSGNVDLGVPRGSNVELDANLRSGRLLLPDPEPRQGPPLHQMAVRAKLLSGDLSIERV